MRDSLLSIKSIILFLIVGFLSVGCSNTDNVIGASKEPGTGLQVNTLGEEIENKHLTPILEIWQDLDGSVRVRGRSLYFRMSLDGVTEFDYIVQKEENELGKTRHTFNVERTHPTKISDAKFQKIKMLLDELADDKHIKQEYKPVALTLDVIPKLTILLKETDAVRKQIVINDADYDMISNKYEKNFPSLLVELIKEIRLIRQQQHPS